MHVCLQSPQNDTETTEGHRFRIESDQEEECSSSEDEDYGDSKYDKMVTGVQNGIKDAYKDNKKGILSIRVVVKCHVSTYEGVSKSSCTNSISF